MWTKLCRKCGDVKSLDEFSRDKTHSDGHSSECKKCKRAYRKKFKAQDPKRYLALNEGCRKRYEILHPGRNAALAKKRYDQDPEVIKARQKREAKRQDRALHPEKYKAQKREKQKARHAGLSAEDREKINAQQRACYANDSEFRAKEKARDKRRKPQHHEAYIKRRDARSPEEIREEARASKAYQAKNREKLNAQARARRAKDPEKFRVLGRKSYQKIKGKKIGFMLLKAMDIIKDELVSDEHEEKLEKARANKNARRDARDPVIIKARQEREAKRIDRTLHPEKYRAQVREYSLAYYYKNREKILAKAKADYAKNPEKYHAYQKKHKDKAIMDAIVPVIDAVIKTKFLKGVNDDKRTK